MSGATHCVLVGLVVLSASATMGCAGKKAVRAPLWSQNQAQKLLIQALEADLPDDRRLAIERLADSKFVNDDATVQTVSVIVRTDSSGSVRCAAARSLGRSGRIDAYEPLTLVLDAEDHPQDVRPADPALRRTSVEALDRLLTSGPRCVKDENLIGPTARLLATDPDREVKIASARLLRHFKHPQSLEALIDALRQPQFAVTYEAERSLRELTGFTHHRRYDDWREWQSSIADPFARAGQTPPGLTRAKPSKAWWKR